MTEEEKRAKKPWGKIRKSDVEIFISFLQDLNQEGDRAAVILSASKLDMLLLQILQKSLLPCPHSEDDLFDGDRPLSTFSAKISRAHRSVWRYCQMLWMERTLCGFHPTILFSEKSEPLRASRPRSQSDPCLLINHLGGFFQYSVNKNSLL